MDNVASEAYHLLLTEIEELKQANKKLFEDNQRLKGLIKINHQFIPKPEFVYRTSTTVIAEFNGQVESWRSSSCEAFSKSADSSSSSSDDE